MTDQTDSCWRNAVEFWMAQAR